MPAHPLTCSCSRCAPCPAAALASQRCAPAVPGFVGHAQAVPQRRRQRRKGHRPSGIGRAPARPQGAPGPGCVFVQGLMDGRLACTHWAPQAHSPRLMAPPQRGFHTDQACIRLPVCTAAGVRACHGRVRAAVDARRGQHEVGTALGDAAPFGRHVLLASSMHRSASAMPGRRLLPLFGRVLLCQVAPQQIAPLIAGSH